VLSKITKIFVIFLVLLFVGVSFFNNYNYAKSIKKIPEFKTDFFSLKSNITIPDDYPTIQEGIDNANPGDIILVRSGIYNENIVIYKKDLHLLGESKYNTVIDIKNNEGHAVYINADGITFEDFTVANARNKERMKWYQSGILVLSSNVTIKNNIISDNRLGLMSYTTAYNLTVRDNMFFYDGFFPACYLRVFNGKLNCTENIPKESLFINVYNNSVNGRPLYYLKNINNYKVPSDAGQVVLVNCTNVTVSNLNLLNIDFSVMLYFCSNCTIKNSTIKNADGELILFISENNTIQKITSINAFHGTCLDIGSNNNIVRCNHYYDCLQAITVMTLCSGNKICRNKITNNKIGLKIISVIKHLSVNNNSFFENEFIDNEKAVLISLFKKPLGYNYNNNITNNNFLKNYIGIFINYTDGIKITNNTFKNNIFSALFQGQSNNFWYNNYWNRPRILPKIIFGYKLLFNKIPIPCDFDVDKFPAKKPQDILNK
jgi:parallel beta-helix repeat protein